MRVTKKFQVEEMEMNMTPMIDVVFQLLIFFLVVSEIAGADRVEDLVLPVASEARPEDVRPDRLVITVDSHNRIWIAGRPRSMQEVESYLKRERRAHGAGKQRAGQPVLVQADKHAKWQYVQDVVEKAGELEFWKLSFSARKEGE